MIAFSWNGQPIFDIRKWAKDRGEQMVRVRHEYTDANPMAGTMEIRVNVIEMPESFFGSMRFGGPRNDTYNEIERYDP